MELPSPSKRHHQKARIGSKYQVEVPSFKSSARAKFQEYSTRDHLFACGLAVPITRIAVDTQCASRKRKLLADQASYSYASTVNSRSPDTQELHTSNAANGDLNGGTDNGSKDANSCASSSKEKFLTWNQDCATTEDGCLGAGEDDGLAVTILPKKRKKKRGCKRNCWLPKRRVSKKPRLEIYSAHCVEEDDEEDSDFQRKIVPGARPESWSSAEASYFRLAIFLLGKRFCEISKFIGTKKVIDVSDYYYSKFYGRPAWSRWKASKSFKCKVSVRGELILVGWRQNELLRRLNLVVSDDAYQEILKATCEFNVHLPEPHPSDEIEVAEYLRRKEEKLDAYVFKLKDVVGLELLEKSVGIGGPREGPVSKRDLASGPYPLHYSLLPRQVKEKHTRPGGKSQHTFYVPMGNDNIWPLRSEDSLQSSLSVGENWLRKRNSFSQEIVQKFWERVWPALERVGWRTIERKMTIRSNPKLMFLRPGVEKLHREERGISYFDNFNQVIEAVKDDPRLRQFAGQLAEDTMDDESDVPDEEEEVRGGWSDDEDMFTTLDGKRTIVPPAIPSARGRPTEDSSLSSSLDIDLNRSLSAVNSKPPEVSAAENVTSVERTGEPQSSCVKRSGFPLGGIDLNLLPADEECVVDAGVATDNLDRVECEFLDCSRVRREAELEPVSFLVDVAHPETELTLSLGNFTNQMCAPCPSILLECVDGPSVHGPSVQPDGAEEAIDTNQLTTPFQFAIPVLPHRMQVPSRKRSFGYRGSNSRGDWFDNGKELVSLPKKRAITLDWIPRGLGEFPVTSFRIHMNKAAIAQFYPGVLSCIAAMPGDWWRQSGIQDSSSHLLSSLLILGGQSSFEAFLKACQDIALYGRSHCVNNASILGFQDARCKAVKTCMASEEVDSKGVSDSEVGEDSVRGRDTKVSSQVSMQKAIAHPASFGSNTPHMLTGPCQGAFQEDTEGSIPQVMNSYQRKNSSMFCFQQPECKVAETNTNVSDDQERIPGTDEGQDEEVPNPEPQFQIRSIRFHFKDRSYRPVVSKERSKRVPRSYASVFKLPKPKAWLRRSEHGEFSSVSESLNSCLTTDSFRADVRNEEEALQGAQLRVKSEEKDLTPSPLSSMRSWGTDDQDEEILSEDYEEEKPFWAEKTSCEMYSASGACHSFDSSLYKSRKRSCDTLSRRRASEDSYISLDAEKLDLDKHTLSDVCAETTDKRIKVSHRQIVLKNSSIVEDMYSDDYEVLPGQAREDHGVEFSSRKTKDKRSKPKHQIRNVSCERFLIMLYTESVEEELPLQSRSSQGPFQAPSHLPHWRGARSGKVRLRRPLLPCRSKKVLPQSTDLRASASASPKRSGGNPVVLMEEEGPSAFTVVKWPKEDDRFTLRRTLLDISAKAGRQCSKRGGGRWEHYCGGC